ncbi:hypothetical protein KP509_37G013100 [Ceratopteris richardii]|uniref:Glycosyltransferase n=1 Tax=Ceratopteris richardii TaxID=49495 RepID=A0A8T2Q7N2_CERRI|nr:hypothetical protein KP509_37G013100 [Ceratopteris richardii]
MALQEQQGRKEKQQHHAVALAFPTSGHVNPVIRFCKLLVKLHGFAVTFVDLRPVPEGSQALPHTSMATPSSAGDEQQSVPLFRRVQIPIAGVSDLFNISFQSLFEKTASVGPDLERLIVSLNDQGRPVTCIVASFNATFTVQSVADKLHIPFVALYPCAASRLLFTHYLSRDDPISLQSVIEAHSPTKDREDVFCRGLPGLPTLFNKDVPHFKHVKDETRDLWELIIRIWKACSAKAHAVAINTVQDLEETTCRALADACDVPIYDVGFWMEDLSDDIAISSWKEDKSCIPWLDQQPNASVLYISFGSLTLLSQAEFHAFIDGVISSKQRFLWVLRPDLVKDIDYSVMVMDIMEKSEGKGLVIEWAPQLQVLAHPSVGGFLTHCGWNSTSESIAFGVPMLCWPYFSDQLLNARYIVDEWKVGFELDTKKEEGSGLKSQEIETAIWAFMEGEEGKIVRKNAQKLKEKASCCLLENGPSYMKLKALVDSLK